MRKRLVAAKLRSSRRLSTRCGIAVSRLTTASGSAWATARDSPSASRASARTYRTPMPEAPARSGLRERAITS
nr:hypothetical protein [Streptomyces sulphureus]